MKWLLACVLALLTIAPTARAQSVEQRQQWLRQIALTKRGPNFAVAAARLHLNIDTALANRQLDTLLTRPYGDMFWLFWTASLWCTTSDHLSQPQIDRLKWCWKNFTPYRGDTENHFLLYYAALFLLSQDLPEQEWWTGRSSTATYDDAKGFLVHWLDETVREGQTEWDSPRYSYYYITPLAILAEYTKDPVLRRKFRAMLELQLADYAIDYLDGSYAGAHSRVSDQGALDAVNNEMASYGDYFFRRTPIHLNEDVAFTALTSFECPEVIREIALDRTKPFESFEYERGRTTLRYTAVRNAPVYRYTYMTSSYALGSIQGGVVQPIQQQSWSLTLNIDSVPNVITGLHPYFGSDELATYFPEYPSFMTERIGAQKAGYPSESKWVGGSNYEHLYQDSNLLLALYDLPDSVRYHHVDLFIPSSLRLEQRDHGLRLTRDSTTIYITLLAPFRITPEPNGWRVRMTRGKSGYVVYVPQRDEGEPRYTLSKQTLVQVVGRRKRILKLKDRSGEATWLFRSPYITSKRGSGVVDIIHGDHHVTLDFMK